MAESGFLFLHKTTRPRSKLGRKGFIQLTLPQLLNWKEVRTGTQAGQEAGSHAEAMEGCKLLPGLLPLACSAYFLIEPKTTSPGMTLPIIGPPTFEH